MENALNVHDGPIYSLPSALRQRLLETRLVKLQARRSENRDFHLNGAILHVLRVLAEF